MAKSSNFFQNIFSSLFGGGDAEAIKKRGLKNVAKNLSHTKYHFYKYGSNQAEPAMAKFFYDIYKAISPVQLMFANATPNALKHIALTTAITDKQRDQLDTLSEDSIKEQARSMPIKDLQKKIMGDLNTFTSQFEGAKIRQTDALYTKLVLFYNFCMFDFYYLLKKFSPTLKERDFSATPKFPTISAAYIPEDLKNFVAVAWALPLTEDWSDIFALLKRAKGVEPISLGTWKKIISHMKSVRDYHVFEMIIQLITEDLQYREMPKPEEYHILDEYLQQIRKQVEESLGKIKEEQAASKIDGLLTQLFSTTAIDSLRYYNEDNSAVLERKHFMGYVYRDPLRYLKHFLLDFTKKEMREISDILLVRGEWATQSLASPMSEAYHQLIEISGLILQLDEKLAESGEYGIKIKTLLPRSDRDREARNIINTVLGDANNEAGTLILTATKNYVVYGRNLKMAVEDFLKVPKNELIVNWKDLDHFAEGELKQKCVDAYKKIHLFVSLMQNFSISVRPEETE